jgi:hypothetical protein
MKTKMLVAIGTLALTCFEHSALAQNRNPRIPYAPGEKPPKNIYGVGLQVISPPRENPEPQSDYHYIELDTGKVGIKVKFTESVDPATVIVGKTLLLRFPKDRNAAATLKWAGQNRYLTITTDKTASELGDGDFGYSLTLKGNPRTPQGVPGPVVKSVRGKILAGGNYVAQFQGRVYNGR